MNEFTLKKCLIHIFQLVKIQDDIVEGIIVRKDDEINAFLNINNKLEGIIKLSEVENLNIGIG